LNQPRCTVSKSFFVETHNAVRNTRLSNYLSAVMCQRKKLRWPFGCAVPQSSACLTSFLAARNSAPTFRRFAIASAE